MISFVLKANTFGNSQKLGSSVYVRVIVHDNYEYDINNILSIHMRTEGPSFKPRNDQAKVVVKFRMASYSLTCMGEVI